jgi:hypothetical protein
MKDFWLVLLAGTSIFMCEDIYLYVYCLSTLGMISDYTCSSLATLGMISNEVNVPAAGSLHLHLHV